jgi:hypothetical protein
MDTLPLQVRHNRIRLPKFQRIRNLAEGWGPISVKPGRTGMWTSSYTPENPEGICDWLRWCVDNEFYTWRWRWAYVYEVARPLRIVEIDSQEDLHALNDEFGVPDEISVLCHADNPHHPIHRWPNWERLAQHFDAIHLTENGQWATRLPPGGDNLFGWDCESTLWLRLHRNTLRFVKKIHLGIGGRRKTRTEIREERKIANIEMQKLMRNMKAARALEKLPNDARPQ